MSAVLIIPVLVEGLAVGLDNEYLYTAGLGGRIGLFECSDCRRGVGSRFRCRIRLVPSASIIFYSVQFDR